MLLDDSFAHSVENKATTARAILLAGFLFSLLLLLLLFEYLNFFSLDIWHPDLLESERQGILNLFQFPQRQELTYNRQQYQDIIFDNLEKL